MSILRAKYKVRHSWLHDDLPSKASPIWKAIESVKNLIIKGACYLIGDGATINVWLDPWVPWLQNFIPKPQQEVYADCPMMVSMLIDNATNHWKVGLINEIFEPASAQAILALPIPQRRRPDKLIWIPDAKGVFSVKSVYRANHNFNITTPLNEAQWKGLWKIKTTKRIRIFLWRMATNSLPTKDILNQRFETFNPSCVLCGNELESICHLFFTCPIAKAVWFESCWGFKTDSQNVQSSCDIIKLILAPPPTTTTSDVESCTYAAKLALNSALPLCFNKENLPEVILFACVVDSQL
ncbi:hypothetical protein SO802_027527 [Lithocarpus litseifolius]|uniref:Reverse transcriptase zinc-binding domain-containing protein n=1 Tax=Lithocarpus litseifolius TaxID=425828 RepID=A0AAW2C4P4_9ROSI